MALHVQLLLQTKIYQLLTGDVTLMALISGVFDHVPDATAFPYVQIGDDVLTDWSSHTFDGFQGTVTIHSWSQAAGKKEVMGVMNRIYTLLHNVDLNITGFKTVSCRQGTTQVIKDPDGKTHHGLQVFNVILGGN